MTEQTVYRAELMQPGEGETLMPEEEEASIDYAVLLRTLNRGRRTIGAVTLGVLAIATAAAFLIAPRYTSKASFIPPNSNSTSSAAALVGQLSQFAGVGASSLLGGVKSQGDLYVGILKSRSIGSELVQRFNLKGVYKVKKESQAEKALASHSAFDVGVKDSIVTISVTDKSPARARDLVNAYLDALTKTNGRLALTEASQRRLFFGQQLAREKDDLENAEVDLKKTEEQSGLIAPIGQTATEIQMIAETRAQIAVRQVELSALRQSATNQNSDVIRLQSEINDLQEQLSRLQTGTSKSGSVVIPTSKVPGLELDYVRKMREVKYHEALFEMLARQYEAAQMDEARDAPLLQVLDPASYPDTKSWPPRMLMIFGGLILGCLAGSGWVLMRERVAGFWASLASGN
ncbi:MAG: Wzz/FepE/Etk N-terminal domain-containing protein [Silvibacterium sp.]